MLQIKCTRYSFIHNFFLAFELVAERSGCQNGGGYNVGKFSPESCASTCKYDGTTMFVLGRTDGAQCDAADQCNCFCVKNADSDGTCVTRSLDQYDLYKIDTS